MSQYRTASTSLLSGPNDDDPDLFRYNIGWASTTDIDYIAATGMLDELHEPDDLFLQLNDNRKLDYRLGRMGNHNIAMSIPSDDLDASAIVDDMLLTFPALRFVLLVGTASGVPSAEIYERIDEPRTDVRLGDVIVGTRIVNSYRQGASTGSETELNQPSCKLVNTGIREFQVRLSDGLDLYSSVASLVEKKAENDPRFRRPDPVLDPFYQVDYSHTPTISEYIAPRAGPASVAVSQTPRTHGGRVSVHYGTVGSVDQRIVDARVRDELARENTLLGFLVGSSDLATKIDCIPICGVCDYADSHQNGAWRGYAALTAAVCAKEFLSSLTERMVLEMRIRALDGMTWAIDNSVEVMRRLTATENSLECFQKAMDKLQIRVDTLERMSSHMRNRQADMDEITNDDTNQVIALDASLKIALKNMEKKIKGEIKTAEYVSRDEWKELRARVDQNTARLDTIEVHMDNLNAIIGEGGRALNKLGKLNGNKKIRDIAAYLDATKELRDALIKWMPALWRKIRRRSDISPEDTDTPGRRRTSSKWQGYLPRFKPGRNPKNKPVATSTEVPDIYTLSPNPLSSSNSAPNSLFNEKRDNGQGFPRNESERSLPTLSPVPNVPESSWKGDERLYQAPPPVPSGRGFTGAGGKRSYRAPPPVPSSRGFTGAGGKRSYRAPPPVPPKPFTLITLDHSSH